MEGFIIFVAIVGLVFGVLQIILFFKLWGMTNNVSRVLLLLEKQTGLKFHVFYETEVIRHEAYKTEAELEEMRNRR